MPRPILRSDVLGYEGPKSPGMVLKGTVRNVIDFGVFVDIGVHQDGLVHISPDHGPFYQASAGSSQRWGYRGCKGTGR